MLQIKNTLGGGKSNAPYAWAKYEAEYCSFESINRTESGKATITSTNLDLDNMTESDFRGFKGKLISNSDSKTYDAYFSYDNDVLTFNYSSVRATVTYDSTTHTLSLSVNLSHVFDFVGFEFVKKTFIEYVTDKSLTKYRNGEVYTDGYFYRYAPEGLYVWKKNEIGSELKKINKSVSTLPYNFHNGCVVVLNGEIHILGSSDSVSTQQYHYKFDGSSWISVSTLPYYFYGGDAVVLNNEIHILGSSRNGYRRHHYKWDGSSWTSVSTLPYDLYGSEVVVLNGEIHILGSGDSNCANLHYKWDGSSWTSVSTLPYSFSYASTVVLNNEIHILGSYNSSSYTKHYKFDGSSWTSVSTLPYNLGQGSTVVLDNEIYILGGRDNTTKHYKWDGNSWTSVSTLPYNFVYGSAVVFDSGIHILGSDNSSYYTVHYLIIGYVPVYTFLDYIVSDKETAYPDGGEKNGYYYERVSEGITPEMFGCTKMAVDKFTLSSRKSCNGYTISHSLDAIPKFMFIIAEKKPTDYYDVFQILGINPTLSSEVNKTLICYYDSGILYTDTVVTNSITSNQFKVNNSTFKYTAGIEYTVITMV